VVKFTGDFMDIREKIGALRTNLKSVIYGKEEVIDLILASFFSGGHVLIEDAPGRGKTTLGQALAKSISGKFKRIQFTSDMLPQDLLGYSIFSHETTSLTFNAGPIFANVVLADEINRTNPKTQAALLEAMSERRVTIDNSSYKLPEPFFVIATQNPFEFHGTFPLPESQLDRFNMKVSLGYPDLESELKILGRKILRDPLDDIETVIDAKQVVLIMESSKAIICDPSIDRYIVEIVRATRNHPLRCSISIKKTSAALALLKGRTYILPDDVKFLAPFILTHRIFVGEDIEGTGHMEVRNKVISEIIEEIPVPA
jgi:MoxR-like ATPase